MILVQHWVANGTIGRQSHKLKRTIDGVQQTLHGKVILRTSSVHSGPWSGGGIVSIAIEQLLVRT
jgi:hypothetical protein